MRPSPAVAAVRGAVRTALAAVDTATVLVACSGGPDSLALAAATAFVAPRLGLRAGAVTVDHGLQPGSAEQAARVAAVMSSLGLDPVHTVRVDVHGGGGPEAAARRARYAALTAVAGELDATVLLGHTLDDQAETVLLGLGRGSGPRSIAGMPPAAGHYLRPLLALRRSVTVAACAAADLPVWHDPHNTDAAFQRVRLRHEVLPLLEDVLQGGVAEALARTGDLLRADLEALDAWAAAKTPAHGPLVVATVETLPRAVRTRVLRAWATTVAGAGPLDAGHTAALDALLTDWHGQGPVPLPGGVSVVRTSGTLVVPPRPVPEEKRV